MECEKGTSFKWSETYDSFDDLPLRNELLRGLYAYGYDQPLAIQKRAFAPCVSGYHTIAQSYAGSGKTSTFSICMLQAIDTGLGQCQGLILTPTREVAKRAHQMLMGFGRFIENFRSHACVGGTAVRNDIAQLDAGQHIVVGTPGRVLDMISRRALSTSEIEMIILDEADELLSRGFKDIIDDIFEQLHPRVQIVILSPTMPPDLLEMTSGLMGNPEHVMIKHEAQTEQGPNSSYVSLDLKTSTVCDLYETQGLNQPVIFCSRKP